MQQPSEDCLHQKQRYHASAWHLRLNCVSTSVELNSVVSATPLFAVNVTSALTGYSLKGGDVGWVRLVSRATAIHAECCLPAQEECLGMWVKLPLEFSDPSGCEEFVSSDWRVPSKCVTDEVWNEMRFKCHNYKQWLLIRTDGPCWQWWSPDVCQWLYPPASCSCHSVLACFELLVLLLYCLSVD